MPVSGVSEGASKARSPENGSRASPEPPCRTADPSGGGSAAEARARRETTIVPSNPWPMPSTCRGDATASSQVGDEISTSDDAASTTNQRPSSKRRTVTVLATRVRTVPSSARSYTSKAPRSGRSDRKSDSAGSAMPTTSDRNEVAASRGSVTPGPSGEGHRTVSRSASASAAPGTAVVGGGPVVPGPGGAEVGLDAGGVSVVTRSRSRTSSGTATASATRASVVPAASATRRRRCTAPTRVRMVSRLPSCGLHLVALGLQGGGQAVLDGAAGSGHRSSSPSWRASVARPRCRWVFTEPADTPMAAAISASGRSR